MARDFVQQRRQIDDAAVGSSGRGARANHDTLNAYLTLRIGVIHNDFFDMLYR